MGVPRRLHNIFNGQNRKIISNNVAIKVDLASSKNYDGCKTLALVDAAETSFWLFELFIQICGTAEKLVVLPLDCYIDSKQLHEALY